MPIIFFFALLLLTHSVSGQTLKGIIKDGESFLPLPNVIILDLATGQSSTSNAAGYFELPTKPGNKLSLSFNGYHTIERLAIVSDTLHVEMLPLTVQLPAYTLHELSQFQKDSTEMATLYSSELNKQKINPKVSMNGGLAVSGLISAPAQRLSRSYKQNKKFKAAYKKDMEQKYIDTRYKPDLVTTLTGLTGDDLLFFMNSNPMDYAFARSATDLEVKAWIRDNYRIYSKSHPSLPHDTDNQADKMNNK